MKYAFYKFKLGYIKIGYEDDKVFYVENTKLPDEENQPSSLSDLAFSQLEEYFQGKRKEFTFPYKLVGTDFQLKVWNALREIPYGQTRTYKEIAIAVGNPKASRAVGMANHNNPIIIAVPCHRVIGSNGKLTGYAGGLDMKEYLIDIEKKSV